MMKFSQHAKRSTFFRLTIVTIVTAVLLLAACIAGFHDILTANALPITEAQSKGYESDYATREEVTEAGLALNLKLMEEGAVLLKNEGNILPISTAGTAPKVTLFGKRSVASVFNGVGSSAGYSTSRPKVDLYASLRSAGFDVNPTAEAFYRNTDLATGSGPNAPIAIYGFDNTMTGEMPAASEVGAWALSGGDMTGGWNHLTTPPEEDLNYDPAAPTGSNYLRGGMRASYSKYNDVAFVVIGRTASENNDGAKWTTINNANAGGGQYIQPGRYSKDDHFRELDLHETNMIKEACHYFNNVILLVNSPAAMELGFMDDPTHKSYYNANIKGALWVGSPGENGFASVGKILNGEINPSGGLVDTYYRNFRNDPTFKNFGYSVCRDDNSDRYRTGATESGSWRFVEYQEGIYMGYRYYETKFQEVYDSTAGDAAAKKTAADAWYKENVIYPFGYGLSYTTFDWTVKEQRLDGTPFASAADLAVKADSIFEIDVEVENTGARAGKDIVQIYSQAPYTANGIEKASKVLAGFGKTKLLAPGDKQTLTISIDAFNMASFDAFDKNNNQFFGYELESGNYSFFVSENAHNSAVPPVTFTISAGNALKIDKDPVTGNDIKVLFPESNLYFSDTAKVLRPEDPTAFTAGKAQVLSRNNNFANSANETLSETRRYVSDAFIFNIGNTETGATDIGTGSDYANNASATHDWHASTAGRQFLAHMERLFYDTETPLIYEDYDIKYPDAHKTRQTYEESTYKFYDMGEWAYDDTRWDSVISNLTWTQISELIGAGVSYNAHIDSIGKPIIPDLDGPIGWATGDLANSPIIALQAVTNCIVAATFNIDLATEYGEIVGEEGIWGFYRLNQSTNNNPAGTSFSGWYAPGANLHRSPFGGRNFEYYSEDGYLSGKIMAGVVIGTQHKGVYCYMKHFLLNDQELHRSATDSRGLVTWACEQTMRELYARAFEIAVKDINKVNTRLVGIMSSYNRIGTTWSAGSNALMDKLLRQEWGFAGVVITDHTGDHAYLSTERAVFAGYSKILRANRRPVIKPEVLNFVGSAALPTTVYGNTSNPSNNLAVPATSKFAKNFVANAPIGNTYKFALRRSVKDILYVTSASNAINTTQMVMFKQSRLNLTTNNNNADGSAEVWRVGQPVKFNLYSDAAISCRPQVNYGDRATVNYKYSMVKGDIWNGSAVVSAPALPKGLALLPDGTIIGTPAEETAGTTITAVDVTTTSGHIAGFQTIILPRILAATGNVSTHDSLFSGNSFIGIAPLEQEFSSNITANVPESYYMLAEGSTLPDGLTLTTTGFISGTPGALTSGVHTFTVDGYLFEGGVFVRSSSKTFTIQIGSGGLSADAINILISNSISALDLTTKLNNLQQQINAIGLTPEQIAVLNDIIVAVGTTGLDDLIARVGAVETAVNSKLDTAAVNTLINGAIAGKLDEAAVNGLITAAIANKLEAAAVTSMINAAIAGKLDTAAVNALINTAIAGKLDTAAVNALITAAIANKLDTAAVNELINTAIAGKLDTAAVNALITAAIADKLDTAAVNALITAAIADKLDSAAVSTLIDAAVSGKLTAAEVNALINTALESEDGLTAAEVQAMIDKTIEDTPTGCNSVINFASAGLLSIFVVVCLAVLVIRKKKSSNID